MIYTRVITLYLYIIRIYACARKKYAPYLKLIDRGLYYSFLDKEVKIKAIIIIKRKSTISLLSNKFKLSKLYRI